MPHFYFAFRLNTGSPLLLMYADICWATFVDGIMARHRKRKITFWTLGVLVILLVGLRLALPSLVQRYVNEKLDELPDYDGHIGDVDIHLIRGAYSIDDVDIEKTTGSVPVPFFSARKVDFSMEWREIFQGALVGEI